MPKIEQLFLNDQEVDLSNDDPIGITFQINDLGEVQNQQGNTSNQFKLPLTQRNRRILGYPDDIKFCNKTPYTKLTAIYMINGVEVFPNAIAEINDTNDDGTASITLLSGNVSFFDLIGGQLIDMGDSTSQWSGYGSRLVWKPYNHIWNLQNCANSQKNTADAGNNGIGGWIYPVVDYGLFTDDPTIPIDVHYMRPGFFIKTVIDLLLKSTGYKAKGSLLNNPLYPLLIAQFSNGSFDHGTDYQNQPDNNSVVVDLAQNINQHDNAPFDPTTSPPTIVRGGIIIFTDVISPNQFGLYNRSTGIYTASQIVTLDITLRIPSFYVFASYDSGSPSSVDINIMYRDPDPANPPIALVTQNFDLSAGFERGGPNPIYRFGYTTIKNSVISTEQTFPVGGEIYLAYEFKGKIGGNFTMYAGAELSIKSNNKEVLFGQEVQCERILPGVSQKDILKDTLQRFGIICQTDVYSASITFASLKDIVNNIPIAKDWTKKCLDQGIGVSYKLSDNYAQVNYLEYQVDPNGGIQIIPLKYGWSQIIIDDETLSVYPTDLIISIFGASLNRPYIGGTTALVQMADPTTGTSDFNIGIAPRILISNKVNLLGLNKSVHFTDDPTGDLTDPAHNIIINDVIDCPYFAKPGGEYSLLWDDLKLMNYQELQQILKDCKKVTRYFLLTERDVEAIDLLIPVYLDQDACYYYINTIENWRPNTPTKVTLIKLG